MNNLMLNDDNIKAKIYEIRGVQVMLDSDLAKLYGCANGTKTINLAVKRNLEKFPNDFCFQLSYEEASRFQNETLNKIGNKRGSNIKYLPYAFTEQGVAMLSSVLKTENAANVSIAIMRAFVTMRHFLIANKDIYLSLNNINNKLANHEKALLEHDRKLNEIFNAFIIKDNKELIYLNGQVYDAYSKIINIIKSAKKELIIIDNYADNIVLDIISNLKVSTTLITKYNNLLKELDIKKYQEQYDNLNIIYSDEFHDRFIILDNKKVFHLGASINHAGKRIFAINSLEDKEMIKILLGKVNKIKTSHEVI